MMEKREVIKQERSMAVYGRVDVVALAEVFAALGLANRRPRTLSMLISYCVEIAHSALEQNGYLEKRFDNISNAYHLLLDSGIMTRSAHRQNKKKLDMAWGFENMRKEGDDPEFSAPGYYKGLHNEHSVSVPEPISKAKAREMVEAMEKHERQKMADKSAEESKKIIDDMKANADENGVVRILPSQKFKDAKATISNEEKPRLGRPPKVVEDPCVQMLSDIIECQSGEIKFEDRKKSDTIYQAWKKQEQLKRAAEIKRKRDDEAIRPKTEDELAADAERIAKKDRELAMMDMSAPAGMAIDD